MSLIQTIEDQVNEAMKNSIHYDSFYSVSVTDDFAIRISLKIMYDTHLPILSPVFAQYQMLWYIESQTINGVPLVCICAFAPLKFR